MPDFVYHGEEFVPRIPDGTTRIVVADSVTCIRSELRMVLRRSQTQASVTTIRLHPGVDYICGEAFSNLSYLTHIENLPNLKRLTTIHFHTFLSCSSLTSLDLSGCVRLTSIQQGAFIWCITLKSVRLPDSVREIGPSAFKHCASLEEFTIPCRVTVIEDSTFVNCASLRCIHIPASVTTMLSNTAHH
jgi:BspA type Leucine rich repeat region (6 copies)